jgi:hypothetical protein
MVSAGELRRRTAISLTEFPREKGSIHLFQGMAQGAGYFAFDRVSVAGCAVVFWFEPQVE